MDKTALFCWVVGDDPVRGIFAIEALKTTTVVDTKSKICQMNPVSLANVDHTTLHLWRVSIPAEHLASVLGPLPDPRTIKGAIRLDSRLARVLEFFLPPPPRQHLHIIVERTDDDYIRERRLRLLCRNYWGRGDVGRAEIFRTNEIIIPDLNEDDISHPVDDTTMWDTGVNSTLPDAPSGTLESFTILSLPDHLNGLFGTNTSKILVRDEYQEILNILNAEFEKKRRGVVVVGHPGIGKSVFLHYLLIDRILKGLPTAYQANTKTIFLFLGPTNVHKFSVHQRLDPEAYDDAWALIDSDATLELPRSEFLHMSSKLFLVHFCSPQIRRWKCWKKEQSAGLEVMRPWSWKEIYIGGTIFESPPLDTSLLRSVYALYGKSPSLCYELVREPEARRLWGSRIQSVLENPMILHQFQGEILGSLFCHDTTNELILQASQILTVIPGDYHLPILTFVSPYIGKRMYDVILRNNTKDFWFWFNTFWHHLASRASAGHIWQPHVMDDISTGPQRSPFLRSLPFGEPRLRPMGHRTRPSLPLPLQPFVGYSDQRDLASLIKSSLPQLRSLRSRPLSFRPHASHQATYDFLTISPKRTITLFKATVSTSHSVKAAALDFIWDALDHATNGATKDEGKIIRSLFPTKTKWRLIFVVPKRVAPSWSSFQTVDFEGREPRRCWEDYLEQFVLEYPDGQ